MSNYVLGFDLSSYHNLEVFARRANQEDNLGDKGDWLNHFIWGLGGLRARVLGVKLNYSAVHSWELTKAVVLSGINVYDLNEYYVSTILFNMDSAIECMIFMLNALGYAVDPNQFRDVANPEELKRINPRNILSDEEKYKVSGYAKYFPSLKDYCTENRDLICKIAEEHDVSKHRSAIFEGGMHRLDLPYNFFEELGITDKGLQIVFSPFAEIILPSQPKIPWRQRNHVEYKDITNLENIAEQFREFINICGVKILDDAGNNIKLTKDKS
ncbi:MAG: hypothetical protein MUO85_09600 [candidate division Zixibacteria bacterium]|nr:hypothetical protein [candidate division Zixibacteria bacterium]